MDAPEKGPEHKETTDSYIPDYRITKSPDFRMIYVNGAFGSVNPHEGRITFYADRIFPKITDEKGTMSTDYVERELQIEVKMSPSEYLSLYNWMEKYVEKLKGMGTDIFAKKEPDE
ncbi:hypothetical protein ES703_46941 [subsurface metagenome]